MSLWLGQSGRRCALAGRFIWSLSKHQTTIIKSNSTRNFVCCLFSRCAVVERSSSIYRLPLDEATGGQKPRLAGPLIGLPTLREKFLDLPRLL
jgi:hypothetical protein